MMRLDQLPQLGAAAEAELAVVFSDGTQWHFFYKRQVDASLADEIDQVDNLVVIAALENNGIDFDALEAGLNGGINPGD
jgi:hypothetical protein